MQFTNKIFLAVHWQYLIKESLSFLNVILLDIDSYVE